MIMFDVLQMVSAYKMCGILDVPSRAAMFDALNQGLVNCIDGRLTLTAKGAAEYRGMRDARSGG